MLASMARTFLVMALVLTAPVGVLCAQDTAEVDSIFDFELFLNGTTGPITVNAGESLRFQAGMNLNHPALFCVAASPANPFCTVITEGMVILAMEDCLPYTGVDFVRKIPSSFPECAFYVKVFAVVEHNSLYCSPAKLVKIRSPYELP